MRSPISRCLGKCVRDAMCLNFVSHALCVCMKISTAQARCMSIFLCCYISLNTRLVAINGISQKIILTWPLIFFPTSNFTRQAPHFIFFLHFCLDEISFLIVKFSLENCFLKQICGAGWVETSLSWYHVNLCAFMSAYLKKHFCSEEICERIASKPNT